MMRAFTTTVLLVLLASSRSIAQSHAPGEEFTAIAIANSSLRSGAGRVIIRVTRWSSEAERDRLVTTLREEGSSELLDTLRDNPPAGSIRTPDSLGYDLRYAYQVRGEDGERRIVIATDRPISFWEVHNSAQTLQYPFTVIQMTIGPDGRGHGTMSYATRVVARGNLIELQNFETAPVLLSEIETRPIP